MVRYYKVNKKVADYLGVQSERNFFKDGTYLLWQNDLLRFGSLLDIPGILRRIGGIGLTSSEAKQEQDGIVLRPLPEPEDIHFRMEEVQNSVEEDTEADGELTENIDQTEESKEVGE